MKINIFSLLLILLSFCGCRPSGDSVQPSGRTLKIGVIAPLSGEEKVAGENALLGIRTALKLQPYLNRGDRIELVTEDSQSSIKNTISALEKFSTDKEVTSVLLMAKSDIVLAVAPSVDQYQMPILSLIATHPDITRGNNFIAQLGFDDQVQGTLAAVYVRDELLIHKVAVFHDGDNAHYSYLAKEFSEKFSSVGGEIAEHLDALPDQEKLRTHLENLQKDNVQLLYLAVAPAEVVTVAKMVKDIGWRPKMMGSDGLLSSINLNFREDLNTVNGIMAIDFFSAALPKTEYGRQAIQLFEKQFSEPETSYTGLACEGTSILLQAIDRCAEKTDRACINNRLRHTSEFQGLFGKISIHENGKAERPIFVNVIDNHKMKRLVKVY